MQKEVVMKDANYTLRLSKELLERLRKEKEDSGVPVAETIRRSVNEYLDSKDDKRDLS